MDQALSRNLFLFFSILLSQINLTGKKMIVRGSSDHHCCTSSLVAVLGLEDPRGLRITCAIVAFF
jgi:hypothetical protein